MSKAFTRESDDLPERPISLRQPSPLPPGAKNYLTSDGARRLREELDRLVEQQRPQAAALPDPLEVRKRLQVLDARIQQLEHSLQTAVIVQPSEGPPDRVRFGATVHVRQRNGEESHYRIVGIDETDFDKGWLSWLSPIAKALLNARVGNRVRFHLPAGEEEFEILGIAYE